MKNLQRIMLIMLSILVLVIFACKPDELTDGGNSVVYNNLDEFIESFYKENPDIIFKKETVKSSIINFKSDTMPSKNGEDFAIISLGDSTYKIVVTGETPSTSIIKLTDIQVGEYFSLTAGIVDGIFFKEDENSDNLKMSRTTDVENNIVEFEKIYKIEIEDNATVVTWEDIYNQVDISDFLTIKPAVHPDNDLVIFALTLVSDDQDTDDEDDDTVHLRDDETGEEVGEVDTDSGDGTEDSPWIVVDDDGNVVGWVWGNECGWWYEDLDGYIEGITGGNNGWHDAQGLDDFSGNIWGIDGYFSGEFLLFLQLNGITEDELNDWLEDEYTEPEIFSGEWFFNKVFDEFWWVFFLPAIFVGDSEDAGGNYNND